MDDEIGPTLRAAYSFAIHVIVAAGLFLLILAAPALIYIVTKFAEQKHWLSPVVVAVASGLEIFAFACDAICFVWLIGVEAWKFCYRLWLGRKE